MKILFAAAGDLAHRTLPHLSEAAHCVGLRRDISKLDERFEAYQANLSEPAQLQGLAAIQFDYVVVTFTPAGRSYQEAYVEASANLLKVLVLNPPKRVFYISSTSTYHQREHEWVDEQSPALATGNGEILRQAEQLWLSSPIASTVLRLSGIYGPDRRFFINKLLAGAIADEGAHYTNRIHSDDAGRAIAHLIACDAAGDKLSNLYLVTDDEPADQQAMVQWAQQQLTVKSTEPPQLLARRAGSKRCSNVLLKSTGFKCLYPSFREGYASMLADA